MSRNKQTFRTRALSGVRGSIVLEATLIMPMFIMVLFLFIYMIQMTVVSTQLHAVASNAVRQVSAHIYPVALAVSSQTKEGQADSTQQSLSLERIYDFSISEWSSQYTSSLPSPISEWVQTAVKKGEAPLQDLKGNTVEALLDPVIKPLIRPFLKVSALNEERLHVSRVTIPDLRTGKTPYFGLEVSYVLPIKVPFTGQSIRIQARAEERLWIGDTDELGKQASEGEEDSEDAVKVLSKPDPAYAGHRTEVTALVPPGTSATMTVYYKSGVSQAKYLGEAIADEHGVISWNWLVGGNTTPGVWTFVIETENGAQATEQFRVESPKSKD